MRSSRLVGRLPQTAHERIRRRRLRPSQDRRSADTRVDIHQRDTARRAGRLERDGASRPTWIRSQRSRHHLRSARGRGRIDAPLNAGSESVASVAIGSDPAVTGPLVGVGLTLGP